MMTCNAISISTMHVFADIPGGGPASSDNRFDVNLQITDRTDWIVSPSF